MQRFVRISVPLLITFIMSSAIASPIDAKAVESASTTPPVQAAPLLTTAPLLPQLRYVGELLDLQRGFVFLSTGDAFRLSPTVIISNLDNASRFTGDDVTGRYARLTFDSLGVITSLEISSHALQPLGTLESIHGFAITHTQKTLNPDLANGEGFTGQPVAVTFTAQVPPSTSFTDNVYMATEASGWDAMAIRMDRVDALHYRITRMLPSGTDFRYRYTRGSWRSEDRDQRGLEQPPREYKVRNLDVARRRDVIFHWSDETVNGIAPVTPDTIPTPFNGRPF